MSGKKSAANENLGVVRHPSLRRFFGESLLRLQSSFDRADAGDCKGCSSQSLAVPKNTVMGFLKDTYLSFDLEEEEEEELKVSISRWNVTIFRLLF